MGRRFGVAPSPLLPRSQNKNEKTSTNGGIQIAMEGNVTLSDEPHTQLFQTVAAAQSLYE